MSIASVSLYCDAELLARQSYAKSLSEQFSLKLLQTPPEKNTYFLVLTDQRLELHQADKKNKPVFIDFSSKHYQYRLKQGRKNELIAKAVGIKSHEKPSIIDATAGWGEDGFVLANLGCAVTWLERSPVMAALLSDAITPLSRSRHPVDDFYTRDPANQMRGVGGEGHEVSFYYPQLHYTNAISYLKNLSPTEYPDVIYLDPMFPERQKSALVKKPMRILRELVGDDVDAAELFAVALQRAKKRVVVKRPRLAPAIEGRLPNMSIKGQSSRFDVYL